MSADMEGINSLLEQYVAACNAGDFDAYIQTLSDDIVWMPPDAPKVSGKSEVGEVVKKEFFDAFHLKFDASFENIDVFGNQAVAPGSFNLDMTPKTGGATIKTTGKFINIFRKQADGSWKYALAIFNFDNPVGQN